MKSLLVSLLLPAVLVMPGAARQGAAAPREALRHIAALEAEIESGLARRGLEKDFAAMRRFTGRLLDASAGSRTFADKTGNCRLVWVDWLLRHPVEAFGAGEEFTWDLHEAARDRAAGLSRIVATARDKLDAGPAVVPPPAPAFRNPYQALAAVAEVAVAAAAALERAFEPLTGEERDQLRRHLYAQSTGAIRFGHRFADQEKGRRVCDLLEMIDRAALLDAAAALAVLVDPALARALSRLPDFTVPGIDGVEGDLLAQVFTPAGRVIVGGRGDNRYDLEQLADVCAVIDLGGDDTYLEGAVHPDRPVLIIIDLSGNDTFRGEKPGIQGGAVLGASLLWSLGGDDCFTAADIAQGSALGGVGLLVNDGGNNRYTGDRRVQGQATGGIGLLLDRDGDDAYRAALLGQGVGGPLGFGLLADLAGDDHYFAGGKYPGGYPDTPGYGAWSQGVGVGPRGVANGGIGVLLDGGGDDVYEYDYFSHGGGYWFAAGFARDFAGDDQRLGATRRMHDGGERTERRYVRWGVGFGCHYAVGLVYDDAGDDVYHADHAGLAFAWDIGVAGLIDMAGNDRYVGRGVAQAANIGLGVLYDAAGDDVYRTRRPGHARPESPYHPREEAGGNFAFLVSHGGENDFGPELAGESEAERGWAGGFFISRPAAGAGNDAGP